MLCVCVCVWQCGNIDPNVRDSLEEQAVSGEAGDANAAKVAAEPMPEADVEGATQVEGGEEMDVAAGVDGDDGGGEHVVRSES